jgi:hypothetical protein
MALHLFVLLLSSCMVCPVACLWHYEFIAHLLQGLYKNANKLRGCCFQDKNAAKLRSFLQEPSDRRSANFVQPQASLPRTIENKPAHCCTPIIDGKKIFSRTPKCYLWWSWAVTLKTPRTIPWCKRASTKPIGSPVWLLAEATSAG